MIEAAVLQVSAFFPKHGGGIEVVAGEIAKKCGSEVRSFTWLAGGCPSELPASEEFPDIELVSVRSNDFLERWLGLPVPIMGVRGIYRLFKEVKRADIIHVHDYLYLGSIFCILFSLLFGKHLILTQHVADIPFKSRIKRGLVWGMNRSLGRVLMHFIPQVTFISDQVRMKFLEFVTFKRPPELILNGVDHSIYFPDRNRKYGQSKNLLFVGRFVEKKGIDLLRGSLDIPGVDWRFVGRGPLSPSRWPELPTVGASVYEDVRGSGVVDFYHWADLLVLPSVGEGFPLVLQEALSCGVPVLVSQEVYDTFPLTDNRCVFSVNLECKDRVAALREKIVDIIDANKLGEEAAYGATKLSNIWCWDNAARSYMELYAEGCPSSE